MIRYIRPSHWIHYDLTKIVGPLADAKAAVMSLKAMPYQRGWVEILQQVQLKREVAGTSRIEGADFTDNELEAAMRETPEQLMTRSQRQASAAAATYRWLRGVPDDRPLTTDLIREIHARIVKGADDDRCPPGQIRKQGENVTFGMPPHRGCEGGSDCEESFGALAHAIERQYPEHDPLIQGLALHYHFAAMHPFLDGNGRTARAMEALMLQRGGLRDALFIPLSNYYYDEKPTYLAALAAAHDDDHDLTPFLVFGLRGIDQQCRRLLSEIKTQLEKAIYRNLMFDLFNRLMTPKKRVIVRRQLEVLKLLLERDAVELEQLLKATDKDYKSLKSPRKAAIRDLNYLISLQAIEAKRDNSGRSKSSSNWTGLRT